MSSLSGFERELITSMFRSHVYREELAAERYKQAIDIAPTPTDRSYINHIVEEETDMSRGHQSYLAEILQISRSLAVVGEAKGNLNMPYGHNTEWFLSQGENLAEFEPQ
jgi:hypothetical protein